MSIEERFQQFEKFVRLDQPARKSLQFENIAMELSATVISTPQGAYIVKETIYYPGDLHGQFSFAALEDARLLSFDNYSSPPGQGEFGLEDVVILDTETTGLSGGVGTIPFLVGLGFFKNGQFIVRQHFLPDLCEEHGFLEHLFDDLPGNILVSFNGKIFDLPLLANRFLIQRTGSTIFARKHLDILFTLRRFFKFKLPDCSLKSAEAKLLSFERLNDVPAETIPRIYFDYLQTGATADIYHVLIHNLWDIVSTLGVLVELNRFVEEANKASQLPDIDSWTLGKFYLQRRELEKARANFVKSRGAEHLLHYKNMFLASIASKRLKDFNTAIDYWKILVEAYNPHYFAALEELSRVNEYRLKNCELALEYCQRGREAVYQLSQLEPADSLDKWAARFDRRMIRLKAKICKLQ